MRCVFLGWFLQPAVLVAAVGEEGGGSSAGAAGGDGLGWQLCLPMDLLGSCPAAQLLVAPSPSPAAELFWPWAIWL